MLEVTTVADLAIQISGEVTDLKMWPETAQVSLRIPEESKLETFLALPSLQDLGLEAGDRVRTLLKSVDVVLIKE